MYGRDARHYIGSVVPDPFAPAPDFDSGLDYQHKCPQQMIPGLLSSHSDPAPTQQIAISGVQAGRANHGPATASHEWLKEFPKDDTSFAEEGAGSLITNPGGQAGQSHDRAFGPVHACTPTGQRNQDHGSPPTADSTATPLQSSRTLISRSPSSSPRPPSARPVVPQRQARGARTVTARSRRGRVDQSHNSRRFCHRCGETFQDWKNLRRHIKEQCEPVRIYNCQHCKYKTPRRDKVLKHHASCSNGAHNDHCVDPTKCGTNKAQVTEAHYALSCGRCGRCFFRDLSGFLRHWKRLDCLEHEDNTGVQRLKGLLDQPRVKCFVDTVLIPQLGGQSLLTPFLEWCLLENQSWLLVARGKHGKANHRDQETETAMIRDILEGCPEERTEEEHASEAIHNLECLLDRFTSREAQTQHSMANDPPWYIAARQLQQRRTPESLQPLQQPHIGAPEAAYPQHNTRPPPGDDTTDIYNDHPSIYAGLYGTEQVHIPVHVSPTTSEIRSQILDGQFLPLLAAEHSVQPHEGSFGHNGDNNGDNHSEYWTCPQHYSALGDEQNDHVRTSNIPNSSSQPTDSDLDNSLWLDPSLAEMVHSEHYDESDFRPTQTLSKETAIDNRKIISHPVEPNIFSYVPEADNEEAQLSNEVESSEAQFDDNERKSAILRTPREMTLGLHQDDILQGMNYLLNPSHLPRGQGLWVWWNSVDRQSAHDLGLFTPIEVTIARGKGRIGMASGPSVVFIPDNRFLDPMTQPPGRGRWAYFTDSSEELAQINFGLQEDFPEDPHPTAEQIWDLRQRNRIDILCGLRREDPTVHVNLVWLPDTTHAEQGHVERADVIGTGEIT
nr:hypothetical protein CFP56_56997 [Quercus suber]